jgi:hypothetical protein
MLGNRGAHEFARNKPFDLGTVQSAQKIMCPNKARVSGRASPDPSRPGPLIAVSVASMICAYLTAGAGRIVPRHSPKPMDANPLRRQLAR